MLLFITIGVFDVLDILIVAFILLQVYRLVKGTAAVNILAGIFTIYLAWLLMKAFDMRLISSILGQFMGVGVIALLIVFQQELRRFLLLLGSRYNLQNIFNVNKIFSKPTISEEVAEEVAKACVNFSATKTGALMVFQLNTELYSYVQTGVALRARVTSELLENIFWKNTPLHDGAVIVQNDRISAARCIMPVSDRRDIPGSMGLRHRAALGISGLSDAYVVVVSEETGNITFFKDGLYKVRVAPDELKRFLCGDFTTFVTK
ncbi:diadenylate cyclase CdaA [Paramuribaculum intestinale]|uniref:diadenylate cyclase CdaA n=1 Tax=Paramuribaculum intestinale TaxID=2094151 RepID=UPI00272D183F|nr:diadenylate cyclase CdaA [Paramuribaculum intestinale]